MTAMIYLQTRMSALWKMAAATSCATTPLAATTATVTQAFSCLTMARSVEVCIVINS